MEAGEGLQLMLEYEAEVNNFDKNIERVDIYFEFEENDELPWETFSIMKLELTDNTLIVANNLNNSNQWHNLGNNVYRLRFNGFSDLVAVQDEIEHNVFAELQELENDLTIEVYADVKYVNSEGISGTFQTQQNEVQIDD